MLVVLPKVSRPGLWSFQNLPNISRPQLLFRIVLIGECFCSLLANFLTRVSTFIEWTSTRFGESQHFNSFTRYSQIILEVSNHCRTDISQPYSGNVCWLKERQRKSSATNCFKDFCFHFLAQPKNAFNAISQSVYIIVSLITYMYHHEGINGRRWYLIFFTSWIFSTRFFPHSRSTSARVFLFVRWDLFFLFIPFAKHAKKFCRRSLPMPKWGSSAASYHQDAAFRRSWTHWNRYIWTMLYLVSYHSFENPPKKSCV